MDAETIRGVVSTLGTAGVVAVLVYLLLKALIDKGFRFEVPPGRRKK